MRARSGKFGRIAALSAAILAGMLGPATSPASSENGQMRPGSVLRGNLTGGIWIELAHDGQNFAELAVLDGLPGGPPQTQFYPLSASRTAAGCSLASADGTARISACPFNGAFSANVSIGAMSGTAVLQEVGWDGSFAWGKPNTPTTDIRARCSLPALSRAGYLAGTSLAPAITTLAQGAQALPSKQGDPSADLARLRADRLKAYSLIMLTSDEAIRARQVEDAVAGRPVHGKVVSLADATREKIAFDKDVVNLPVRVQAREDLVQIDRALSGIYDIQSSGRTLSALTKLKQTDYPNTVRALKDILSLRQPGAVSELIALEAAAGELDACGTALGLQPASSARESVRSAMIQRAPDIAAAIRIAVNASAGSAAARSTLQTYENNAAVRHALEAAGQTAVLEDARGKILQLAAAEEKARIDAAKQAALEAERDKIPPTTKKGGFEFSRISSANVFILNTDENGRGSGFIIAPGYVVTNQHVVGKAKTVLIVRNGDQIADALLGTVLKTGIRQDMALVSVSGLKGKTVALSGVDPTDSDSVWAVGFPGMADRAKLELSYVAKSFTTNGVVNRIIDQDLGIRSPVGISHIIQHSAAIAGGNSGGALYDDCHRVVGVNTQGWGDPSGRSKNEISIAVSSLELIEFLKGTGVSPSISNHECR
ncbi:trypsin-like peptidase domain-containing protein [Hyphomonas sp.]|uniref:trypsin-like peptidase domain-containing protein n=1 Tax=Hyphomonas sp. TaxID=87 RepID=UPI00391B222C